MACQSRYDQPAGLDSLHSSIAKLCDLAGPFICDQAGQRHPARQHTRTPSHNSADHRSFPPPVHGHPISQQHSSLFNSWILPCVWDARNACTKGSGNGGFERRLLFMALMCFGVQVLRCRACSSRLPARDTHPRSR